MEGKLYNYLEFKMEMKLNPLKFNRKLNRSNLYMELLLFLYLFFFPVNLSLWETFVEGRFSILEY